MRTRRLVAAGALAVSAVILGSAVVPSSAQPRRPGGPPMRPPGMQKVSPMEIVDLLKRAGISGMFLFAAPPMVQKRHPDLVYAFVTAPHDPVKKGPSFNDETPGHIQQLDQLVAYYRAVLGQLPPATAGRSPTTTRGGSSGSNERRR